MVDWFRGPTVETVRLQGLELVIALTALDEHKIIFRVYRFIFSIKIIKNKYYLISEQF